MVRLIRSLAVAVAATLLWSGAAMAQACGTVTTCPTASTPLSGSELLYLVQGGVSKKITVGSIFGASQPANSIALSSLVNQPASTILANPAGSTGPVGAYGIGSTLVFDGSPKVLDLASGAAVSNIGFTPLNAAATTLPASFLASSLTSAAGGSFGTGAYAAAYSLPTASTTVLGGVTYGTAAGTAAQGNDSRFSSPTITGGTIDGAAIGGTTPAAAHFTTLNATGNVTLTGLLTSGTIGGALCRDASGDVIANGGANCYPGGSASAGGSNTQVQYNASSSLGGISGVTSNGTAMTFATSDLVINGGTATAGLATVTSGGVVSSEASATVAQGGTGVGTLASNGLLYGNGTSAVQALAVNSSATNKFATQSSSGAPAWNTIAPSDLPEPTASTLGGIKSLAAASHEWINAISTLGVPSATQPACADLSDSASGCSTAAYSLPTASTTVLGGVKVDGSTITIASGVISSTGGGGGSNIQVFTSSGTWTKPTFATGNQLVCIQEWGGGGGGGEAVYAAGGGGGAQNFGCFNEAALPSTVTVTVGAAGTGASTANGSGGVGGETSFGAYLLAYGGGGGSASAATTGSNGGGGGGVAGSGSSISGGNSGGNPTNDTANNILISAISSVVTGCTCGSNVASGLMGPQNPFGGADAGPNGTDNVFGPTIYGGASGGQCNGPSAGLATVNGGGGGGAHCSTTVEAGGATVNGGSGGVATTGAGAGAAGSLPGGGGAGGTTSGGAGGAGELIVTTIY